MISKITCTNEDYEDCVVDHNVNCPPGQALVIDCEGSGNPSGKESIEAVPAQPPLLGMLPLATPYLLGCDTRISDDMFQGDPGSIYIAKCPNDCQKQALVIHGNGIYDDESPVCKAAVHSGAYDLTHQFITVKITRPMKRYDQAEQNQIQSLPKKWS